MKIIYLVGEVDTGSMSDQLPDNPHTTLLSRHHEGSLLSSRTLEDQIDNILYNIYRDAKILPGSTQNS